MWANFRNQIDIICALRNNAEDCYKSRHKPRLETMSIQSTTLQHAFSFSCVALCSAVIVFTYFE